MAGEADHQSRADTVVAFPHGFAIPYFGRRGEEYHKPVHRPPLKYSSDHQLLPLIASSFAKGYACGFGYYAAEFLYKIHTDKTHPLYRGRLTSKHVGFLLLGSTAIGVTGGLSFGIECCVLHGTEFGLERLRGVRDIYNLTIAGGLGFGALHIFSAENFVAITKQQSRFLGRFPLMIAIGAAVGSFAHAAEFAFYHITTMAQKKFVKLENPAGSFVH